MPNSVFPSPSSGARGQRAANPLTSSGLAPPTSMLPPPSSEGSLRRRLVSEDIAGLPASQGEHRDDTGDTTQKSTTNTEVQEERARRMRDTLGMLPREGRAKVRDEAAEAFQVVFETFLGTFSTEESERHYGETRMDDGLGGRMYERQISRMRIDECATVFVDFSHLVRFDERAAQALADNFLRLEPYLAQGASRVYRRTHGSEGRVSVAVFGLPTVSKVRALRTAQIGALTSISGTVTRTSEVRPELISGVFRCNMCGVASGAVAQQFKYTEPAVCDNPTCQNRTAWTLSVAQSVFADWQRVRVQENASEIPPGSMPRTLDVIVRGDLVERVKPGDRAIFCGCLVALPDVAQLAGPGQAVVASRDSSARGPDAAGVGGLKALGARELTYRLAYLAVFSQAADAESVLAADGTYSGPRSDEYGEAEDGAAVLRSLTQAEREELEEMSNSGASIYGRLVQSIAPTVFGHEEVKRGILLQLLGGVHKRTREGMRLRGDINVCIVGDPSTSKSQFLKYVAGFLPRAIFTSGKASSAAGLTASVVKDDETGDFTIEAGALMLADHGICAIDEFDKMDVADQVAIHEAMEQQTISIAKAGIHATLNARTSILAAANPVGGRYDRRLTLRQNVAMSAPIMSRFDLFFVVLDDANETTDFNTARHIVAVHQKKDDAISPPFEPAVLRRYIRHAKTIQPVLTEDAGRLLWESYRNLRQEDVGAGGIMGGRGSSTGKNAYRITVRQLESLIRLSEALARVHCEREISTRHVREAVRLLRRSIVHVEMDDVDVWEEEKPALPDEVVAAEPQPDDDGAQAKHKVTIKRDEFDRVRSMLVLKLHESEERGSEGVHRKALIDWYLDQREEAMESEDDFHSETRLAKTVLGYLVNVEGCVIALRDGESQLDGAEGPLLMLHPNFAIDS